MLTTRRLLSALTLCGLLLAGGQARAQLLDDQWFKVKVSSSGFIIDANDGDAIKKASFSNTAFLHFTFVTDHYLMEVWTETAPGAFGMTDAEDLDPTVGADEAIVSDTFIEVEKSNGDVIQAFFNLRFTIKKDKNGAFASAQVKAVGGEAVPDSTVGGNDYVGTFTMSGKTLDPSKLPFTPPPPPPPGE
jgi:hypothetical protein